MRLELRLGLGCLGARLLAAALNLRALVCRLVALGLAARRLAASRLQQPKAVQKLFDKIVPQMEGRNGGYTRIVKTGARKGDGAEMCILQWVESLKKPEETPAAEAPKTEEPAK